MKEESFMADATTEFFQALSRHGSEPLLRDVNATVRFDITNGGGTEHWLVTIEKGNLRVAQGTGEADCVVGMDRVLADGILSGRTNAVAALLRGELTVGGDPELLVLFAQRLIPGPRETGETQPVHVGGR
jgi:putative sterol carrier protein